MIRYLQLAVVWALGIPFGFFLYPTVREQGWGTALLLTGIAIGSAAVIVLAAFGRTLPRRDRTESAGDDAADTVEWGRQ